MDGQKSGTATVGLASVRTKVRRNWLANSSPGSFRKLWSSEVVIGQLLEKVVHQDARRSTVSVASQNNNTIISNG
jgi:hypothetical protein